MRSAFRRHFLVFLSSICVSLLSASFASAQAPSHRVSCPELAPGAAAADEALCWFEAERRRLKECNKDKGGVSACISQAVSWCADAALDAAPVANACFLSYLRAGQLGEALAVSAYLQTPAQEAQKCLTALSSVSVRVISTPAGATIAVSGQRYGKAPVEVRLTGNWWSEKITATFGSGASATEIEASSDALIDAFDPRACVMGDLVIEGPEGSAAAPEAGPLGPGEVESDQTPEPQSDYGDSSDGPFAGRLWTWVALGGAVAFGGAAVAFGLTADSQYDKLMKKCPEGCTDEQIEKEIDDSGVETSDLLANISLGLSGACLAGAVVLYFVEEPAASESAELAVGIGPGAVLVSGRF